MTDLVKTSLPDRQLRKVRVEKVDMEGPSLPDRQLRNTPPTEEDEK